MHVDDAIRARFSCRRFAVEAVADDTLRELLAAACRAPNGGNLQPWRFVVVRRAERRQALAGAALGQAFLAQAPVVIAVCTVAEESARHYGTRGRELYCLQDTAAATQNLLLAATARGLGSCWVGAFDEAAARRVLELPDSWRPVVLVALGRPAESAAARSRRPLDEVVRWID